MLNYRLAIPQDSQLYFEWANDPDTRHQSFNSAPISLETHQAWFSRKLADTNALLLVFSNEDETPVGQVRFERTNEEVIIGVSVDTRFRGQGLASELIKQGCDACKRQWGGVTIHAYIKPENQASFRSFEKAGFTFSHESGKFGVQSLVYTLPA